MNEEIIYTCHKLGNITIVDVCCIYYSSLVETNSLQEIH